MLLGKFILRNLLHRSFNGKQFHTTNLLQAEVLKEISCAFDPYANVKIKSSVNLKILPIDYLSRTEARLICNKTDAGNFTEKDFEFEFSNGVVSVLKNRLDCEKGVECILEIPPTCNLNVEVDGDLEVSNFLNEEFLINARGSINTKNIKSHRIDIKSENGNIVCGGLLLGQNIRLFTGDNGAISLMRIIGQEANICTEAGDISTKFSMVENVYFVTKTGSLDLKNINKTCNVDILEQGNLKMTGVTAQVIGKIKTGNIYLQLTEIYRDSSISIENSEISEIYIDDWVHLNAYLSAESDKVIVEDDLLGASPNLADFNKVFEIGNKSNENKLLIKTKGVLKLGKKSWADNALLMFNK